MVHLERVALRQSENKIRNLGQNRKKQSKLSKTAQNKILQSSHLNPCFDISFLHCIKSIIEPNLRFFFFGEILTLKCTRKIHTRQKSNRKNKNKKGKTSITAVYNHFRTTKQIYRGTSIGIAFTERYYSQIKPTLTRILI